MADKKTYLNGIYIKERESQYGKFFSVSFNVSQMISELEKYQNQAGFVNVAFFQRKDEDKHGNTHYAVVNENDGSKVVKEEVTVNDIVEEGEEDSESALPF